MVDAVLAGNISLIWYDMGLLVGFHFGRHPHILLGGISFVVRRLLLVPITIMLESFYSTCCSLVCLALMLPWHLYVLTLLWDMLNRCTLVQWWYHLDYLVLCGWGSGMAFWTWTWCMYSKYFVILACIWCGHSITTCNLSIAGFTCCQCMHTCNGLCRVLGTYWPCFLQSLDLMQLYSYKLMAQLWGNWYSSYVCLDFFLV